MGLIEDCKLYFKAENLYDVLNVQQTASDEQLKKAYRVRSLAVHPDRVDDDHKEEATKAFQVLSKVYFILCDKDRRSVYDETGEIDDENDIPPERDWSDYWRLLFPKITLEDIKKYEQKYKGSEEEVEDLIAFYEKYEGDMDNISESLPFYHVDEEARYISILNELIKNKKIKAYKSFTHESQKKKIQRKKREKRYASEAAEAEEAAKVMNLNESSLEKAILAKNANRERNFNSLLDSLEAKYAKPSARNSRKGKK